MRIGGTATYTLGIQYDPGQRGVELPVVTLPEQTIARDWRVHLGAWLYNDAPVHELTSNATVGSNTFVGGIEAVATDLVTVPNVYRQGDGPVQLTTTGTLPAGLATGTNYWLIVPAGITTGVNQKVGFAASPSNARNGEKINLTGSGTGTHTIVPQASFTRVYEIVPDVKVGNRTDQPVRARLAWGVGPATFEAVCDWPVAGQSFVIAADSLRVSAIFDADLRVDDTAIPAGKRPSLTVPGAITMAEAGAQSPRPPTLTVQSPVIPAGTGGNVWRHRVPPYARAYRVMHQSGYTPPANMEISFFRDTSYSQVAQFDQFNGGSRNAIDFAQATIVHPGAVICAVRNGPSPLGEVTWAFQYELAFA